MTVLPAAYLPSIEYFARLLREPCTVDLGEHFVKRSQRNRARILSAGGVMELSVHVQHADRPRTPMHEVRIDYSKRWQHQHLGALRAAYKSSPYFDHYFGFIEPLLARRYDFLVDLDLDLTQCLLRLLGHADRMPRIVRDYLPPSPGIDDLRPRKRQGPVFTTEPYVQVFSDRLPFAPNLSVADLLFAEGPAAAALLGRCRIG